MNVSSINPYLAPDLERVAARPVPAARPPAQATAADATQVVRPEPPVEAPQGTDGRLWSVLTSDERSFFGRARPATSPVYGPSGSTGSVSVPGRTLNVRV